MKKAHIVCSSSGTMVRALSAGPQQDLLAFFLPEETTANKKIRRNTEMKKLTYLIYVIYVLFMYLIYVIQLTV